MLKLIYCGRLHVVKVPSQDQTFFPYLHFADAESAGPLLELLLNESNSEVLIRVVGAAKLKPNIQTNPKLRIDIYGPHTTALRMAEAMKANLIGAGVGLASTPDNPEKSRIGPQTLPLIDKQYKVPLADAEGGCSGFIFSGSKCLYFDHERPNDGHIEMAGPEMHIGVPLRNLAGANDPKLIISREVPESEVRVRGETKIVRFSPLEAQLTLTKQNALNFAETILNSYRNQNFRVIQSQYSTVSPMQQQPSQTAPTAPSVEKVEFVMPYGLHKGKLLSFIPRDYLKWLIKTDHAQRYPGLISAMRQELEINP